MPDYRRVRLSGGTYFFTVVSYRRRPILCNDDFRIALRESIRAAQTRMPFSIDAWVLLPDHLHCLWTLPAGDCDFSTRWSLIKRSVTKTCKANYTGPALHPVGCAARTVNNGAHGAPYEHSWASRVGCAARTFGNIAPGASHDESGERRFPVEGNISLTQSRRRRNEGVLWQRRFWEHAIRDDEDVESCIDYVHWNPVRHGYVDRVVDWPFSTFYRFVRRGLYEPDWGDSNAIDKFDFGE